MGWRCYLKMENVKKPLTWGKYQNIPFSEVIIQHPDYVSWMQGRTGIYFSDELKRLIDVLDEYSDQNKRRTAFDQRYKAYLQKEKGYIESAEERRHRKEFAEKEKERVRAKAEFTEIILSSIRDNSILHDTDTGKHVWIKNVSVVSGETRESYRLKDSEELLSVCKTVYRNRYGEKCEQFYISYCLDKNTIELRTKEFADFAKLMIEEHISEYVPSLPTKEQILEQCVTLTMKDVVIRSNNFYCFKNHTVRDVYIELPVVNQQGVMVKYIVSGGFCRECGKWFITNRTFQEIKEKGIIACQIITRKQFISGDYARLDINNWAKVGPLKQMGYSVGQDGGSLEQRRRVLEMAIEEGNLTKARIVGYLEHFIKLGRNNEIMYNAIEEWESDLKYISQYRKSSGVHIVAKPDRVVVWKCIVRS